MTTWQHVISKEVNTKTEAYFMWQRDAYTGGSVNIGPPQSFGGGGGAGTFIPGYSLTYGLVNYTMFQLGKNDFLTLRNELLNDPQGEHSGYRNLSKAGYTHGAVNHRAEEYVRGKIHTNTIESFWSLLKRGIMGSFHQVSKQYLPLYVNEFAWRYNNRIMNDAERFDLGIRGIIGKRITYKELIGKIKTEETETQPC